MSTVDLLVPRKPPFRLGELMVKTVESKLGPRGIRLSVSRTLASSLFSYKDNFGTRNSTVRLKYKETGNGSTEIRGETGL